LNFLKITGWGNSENGAILQRPTNTQCITSVTEIDKNMISTSVMMSSYTLML